MKKNYNEMTTTEYYDECCQEFPEYEKAFEVLTSVNGFTKEVLDDAIYVITGYRSLEQYITSYYHY